MIISCKNGKAYIDIGGYDTWKALSSTIQVRLKDVSAKIPCVLSFLESGTCNFEQCLCTAKQFNIVRDSFALFSPDKVVYDAQDLTITPPWGRNISPIITSCGNYFTTADGRDLLAEIVRLFSIAAYTKTDVKIE